MSGERCVEVNGEPWDQGFLLQVHNRRVDAWEDLVFVDYPALAMLFRRIAALRSVTDYTYRILVQQRSPWRPIDEVALMASYRADNPWFTE